MTIKFAEAGMFFLAPCTDTSQKAERECTRWRAVSPKPIFNSAKDLKLHLTSELNLQRTSRNRARTDQNTRSIGACCATNVNTLYTTFMALCNLFLHLADTFCSSIPPPLSNPSISTTLRNVLKNMRTVTEMQVNTSSQDTSLP